MTGHTERGRQSENTSPVTLEGLKVEGSQLVGHIKEYVKAQLPLWRVLPELALAAAVKQGTTEETGSLIQGKRMPLALIGTAVGIIQIDTQTGDFVKPERHGPNAPSREDASDDEIIFYFSRSPELLDAKTTIRRLLEEAEGEYSERVDPEEREQYRQNVIEAKGYKRPDFEAIKKMINTDQKKSGGLQIEDESLEETPTSTLRVISATELDLYELAVKYGGEFSIVANAYPSVEFKVSDSFVRIEWSDVNSWGKKLKGKTDLGIYTQSAAHRGSEEYGVVLGEDYFAFVLPPRNDDWTTIDLVRYGNLHYLHLPNSLLSQPFLKARDIALKNHEKNSSPM